MKIGGGVHTFSRLLRVETDDYLGIFASPVCNLRVSSQVVEMDGYHITIVEVRVTNA
jgi:hypothetical protein